MKFKPKQHPQRLPGSFWGITTFFNPQGYKNKLKNYLAFRDSSKRQGLKLLTVELAFDEKPFELGEKDTDILIQLRTNAVMWQRECLVNIGIKKLPKDCDKFAWVDCDIIFENNNWIKDTSDLLEKYYVIQPFSSATMTSKNSKKINNISVNSAVFKITKEGIGIIKDFNIEITGHTGFVWAGRKNIFNKFGFYDKCVMGGCDRYMILSFYNLLSKKASIFRCQSVVEDVLKWGEKVGQVINGSVFFTPGNIIHLYHGSLKDRRYSVRDIILNKYKFDPRIDVKKDENGILAWNSNKKDFHEIVRKYFWVRNEEGETSIRRLTTKFG